MADLDKNTFEGKFNSSSVGLFKNNTSGDIGADDARTLVEDVADSFLNRNDDVVDEDDMASNSALLVPTQQSVKAYADAILTREFDRAFSAELLFDKNEIEGVLHTQTAAITFTVAESGNLSGQWSYYGQRVVLDGVNPVYFEGFNHVSNIASGDILDAGTYQFIFWFSNGIARASIMLPRQEVVLLTPLATPTNFSAVPGTDPDTELDLSWTAVTNASSYEIDFSTSGGAGPWTTLTSPASGDTSYTHTGRTPNTTYHYRIRAMGDLVEFSNSTYAITAGTTEDAGDVTDPTFVFFPADLATDIVVNEDVTITSSEPLRDADGVTEIVNGNVTDYVTASGSVSGAISITGTIDLTKTIFTINPVGGAWPENEDITITISGVEDLNGNEPASDAATFTTSDFTEMVNNNVNFGTQLDAVLAGNDINFEMEFEFEDILLTSGERSMAQKYNTSENQVSHRFYTEDDDVNFAFYLRETAVKLSRRTIKWADALNGVTSGKITLKYFGAIDTNNGLDRGELYLDDVLISAGKSVTELGTAPWPFAISGGTAPFLFRGPTFRRVRNLKIRNNMGATTVLDVPIIRTGEDVSGNSFDGTWE